MAKTDNLTDFLADIAEAIRAKKGTTEKINPQDFRTEIESIETGVYELCGKWLFNSELPKPSEDIVQEVNFTATTNGWNFSKMEITYLDEGAVVDYYKADTEAWIEVYAPDGTVWENYREVNYGTTPQSVSKAYYEYVTANAEIVIAETVEEWDGSFTIGEAE